MSQRAANSISDLVGLAYESAASPGGWRVLLERLAFGLRSIAPALNLTGKDRDQGTLWISPDADPEWLRRYDQHFIGRDPRRPNIQATRAGGVFVGHKIFPDGKLVRSEFFNDFLRPQGFFHIMGGVPIKQPDRMAVIRFIRSQKAKPFGEEDKRLLERLMPHLSHALRLHWEFAGLRAERDGARDALDRLRHGVILLDREGVVVGTNERAREILERGDGLALCDGRLQASNSQEQDRLEKTLERARTGDGMHPERFLVSKLSGGGAECGRRRLFSLRIERLAGGLVDHVAKRAAIAVFIEDPDDSTVPPADLVSDALGLSDREAEVVVALAAGAGVRAIAASLGMTYETARKHLANARKRTGTHSQKDLVRLVLSTGGDGA